jgi:hypothetical protein
MFVMCVDLQQARHAPEFIGIYVGSLDDASAFKPAVALFCSRGYGWDYLDSDVPKLPEWHPSS